MVNKVVCFCFSSFEAEASLFFVNIEHDDEKDYYVEDYDNDDDDDLMIIGMMRLMMKKISVIIVYDIKIYIPDLDMNLNLLLK